MIISKGMAMTIPFFLQDVRCKIFLTLFFFQEPYLSTSKTLSFFS